MRIGHESRSDTGRRSNNEDAVLALPERGLFAVADGMGGYEGGEVASGLALASIKTYFEMLGDEGLGLHRESLNVARERMRLAIRLADREVSRRAVGRLRKMGTTLACVAIDGDLALVAHVGDSRVYRLRENHLEALTLDHSLYAHMQATGLTGVSPRGRFPLSNVITQSIGQGPVAVPDMKIHTLLPGDRLLLCTDGLSDVLDDDTIAWLMTRNRDVAAELVEAAADHGSRDNITALVLCVTES